MEASQYRIGTGQSWFSRKWGEMKSLWKSKERRQTFQFSRKWLVHLLQKTKLEFINWWKQDDFLENGVAENAMRHQGKWVQNMDSLENGMCICCKMTCATCSFPLIRSCWNHDTEGPIHYKMDKIVVLSREWIQKNAKDYTGLQRMKAKKKWRQSQNQSNHIAAHTQFWNLKLPLECLHSHRSNPFHIPHNKSNNHFVVGILVIAVL